jgi:hypothetical protein
MYRQSTTSQLDYNPSDRVSVLSAGQYSDRLSDRPAAYDRQHSDADRHHITAFSDRTGGGGCVVDGGGIEMMGGGGGTVVRVVGGGGESSGPPADRGPPAGSHRVLLKLRHRSVVMVSFWGGGGCSIYFSVRLLL